MSEFRNSILSGESDIEQLRSEVINRAQDENQTEENLIKAKNDLYLAPFSTKEKIEAFFKNDSVAYELLISKLAANNLTESFYNIMHHIKQLPDFEDFINYEPKDYYSFFINKTEFVDGFVVNPYEFENLIRFISMISYDGHGKTEIAFNLFFDKTTLLNHTDLYVNGKHGELKASYGKYNGGMIKSSKQINHPRIIIETIKNCLKNDIDPNILNDVTTSGIKGFNNLVNILRENNISDKFIITAVANGIFSQFFDFTWLNQFMMFVNLIDWNEDTLAEQLYRLHGVCAIISYKIVDKWDYLCVSDVESGKYLIIDIPQGQTMEDISWRDYKMLYDNKDIIFRGGPSTTAKDERSYVSTIYCV